MIVKCIYNMIVYMLTMIVRHKVYGSPVTWISKKQATVALSSAESEYMSLSASLQEVRWLQMWLNEVLQIDVCNVPIYTDSQSALAIGNTGGSHQRTKHIDIRHHHVREHIESGLITLSYVPTEVMQADVLTKALGPHLFIKHVTSLLCAV
jgi:hypothetical protein